MIYDIVHNSPDRKAWLIDSQAEFNNPDHMLNIITAGVKHAVGSENYFIRNHEKILILQIGTCIVIDSLLDLTNGDEKKLEIYITDAVFNVIKDKFA